MPVDWCFDPQAMKNWVFDCDGVLLNSNRLKTDAFHQAALPYGEAAAAALVAFHTSHGGISRFKKFAYLFSDILNRPARVGELEALQATFAEHVQRGLLSCASADCLHDVMDLLGRAKKPRYVVSGSAQDELREILSKRDIARLFQGIFGSPDSKKQIFVNLMDRGLVPTETVYVGDSRYDYQAAKWAGFNFCFLHGWSEFVDWRAFFADKRVTIAKDLCAIRAALRG